MIREPKDNRVYTIHLCILIKRLIERIYKLEITEECFDYDITDFNPKAYFDASFGVFQSDKKYKVSIEFEGIAAQLVQERQWHRSQSIKKYKNGKIKFTIEVSHLYDILPWILSWSDEAKVISPKELVLLVAEKTNKMFRKYSNI